MSRRRLKSRGKITQKMRRGGLIERNVTTGEEKRVSKRESDFDLRGKTAEIIVGNQSKKPKKSAVYRQKVSAAETENQIFAEQHKLNDINFPAKNADEKSAVKQNTSPDKTFTRKNKLKIQRNIIYHAEKTPQ
jgi:hypothetical protein